MAHVKPQNGRPRFVRNLLDALVEQLGGAGIDAEADSQRVSGTKLHRIIVLSPRFAHLEHVERQDLVWRVAERILTPEEQMRVSMILPMTPEEFAGPAEASSSGYEK